MKTDIAGNRIHIAGKITASRAKKARKSKQTEKNPNDKDAKKQIVRLVNTNFAQTDIWMSYTCDSAHLPKSDEEAERMVKNFIRRVKYRRKKLGLPALLHIYVMEHRKATKPDIIRGYGQG